MRFNLVAVAGTFDHLHLGHQKLIEAAKANGRKVIIGLCRKSMLTNKAFTQSLESYTTRRQALARFQPDHIVPLSDIYGPAATSTEIMAIVCSPLSRPNADKINQKRRLNNLNYLSIVEVPLVKCSDGQILSSTRIRQGLVNRQGLVYQNLFLKKLILPGASRCYFQTPFGQVGQTPTRKPQSFTACVGDFACLSLTKQKIPPDLAIVDLKVNRRPFAKNLKELSLKPGLTAVNPAATITPDLAEKILSCLSQKISTLLVDGEEDLAVLPAVLLSPLKSTIYYGQPNKGLVKIIVTEKTKQKAQNLLRKFI